MATGFIAEDRKQKVTVMIISFVLIKQVTKKERSALACSEILQSVLEHRVLSVVYPTSFGI
jgi:hypothetical protein